MVLGDGQLLAMDGTVPEGACNLFLASYKTGHQTGFKDPSNYIAGIGKESPIVILPESAVPVRFSRILLNRGIPGSWMAQYQDSCNETSKSDNSSPEMVPQA